MSLRIRNDLSNYGMTILNFNRWSRLNGMDETDIFNISLLYKIVKTWKIKDNAQRHQSIHVASAQTYSWMCLLSWRGTGSWNSEVHERDNKNRDTHHQNQLRKSLKTHNFSFNDVSVSKPYAAHPYNTPSPCKPNQPVEIRVIQVAISVVTSFVCNATTHEYL